MTTNLQKALLSLPQKLKTFQNLKKSQENPHRSRLCIVTSEAKRECQETKAKKITGWDPQGRSKSQEEEERGSKAKATRRHLLRSETFSSTTVMARRI